MAGVADSTERRDALVERLFMNAIGAFDLFLCTSVNVLPIEHDFWRFYLLKP
jgi:hypothetical protein